MKSFINKVTGAFKTKRIPVAPNDCQDFVTAVPNPPTIEHLKSVIQERHFGGMEPAATAAERERREFITRGTIFDLKYRCGAEGRCTCAGAPSCRFPSCFTLRPIIKGAEIQAERNQYEVEDAPTASIRALVELAKHEKLEETVKGIQHLVHSLVTTGAKGAPLASELLEKETEFTVGRPVQGSDSAAEGVNPLRTDEALREEVISLYLWRASLLVCLRRDEEAVNSLLNLSRSLEQKHRTRLLAAATTWGCLSDMEIIYYRSLVKQYQPFPLSETIAYDIPLLLPRVFDFMKGDDYHIEYCVHLVFSKEVTATVSRAQAAQQHHDVTEDPMRSLCIPMSMQYYRFRISTEFWKHFLSLLCMPPVPPPTETEEKRNVAVELGLTPNYVLDAVGRSMLLHHLVIYADTRQKEIDNNVVQERVTHLEATGKRPEPGDYDVVLTAGETRVAVGRMRQLLVVVKTYGGKGGRACGRATTSTASGGGTGKEQVEEGLNNLF
ncbi:hypothetical protein AGDE_04962 [Angomonas deanei]|nr:hypothetical protein AGDE_04962 [Angomonas deanei]|eukprot:EPY38967.1 hypothetical protein AGDE_04962 [Angomonas deanei]